MWRPTKCSRQSLHFSSLGEFMLLITKKILKFPSSLSSTYALMLTWIGSHSKSDPIQSGLVVSGNFIVDYGNVKIQALGLF